MVNDESNYVAGAELELSACGLAKAAAATARRTKNCVFITRGRRVLSRKREREVFCRC